MGGKSTQQTNQTQTNSLPANQQMNVDALMQGALNYYNSGGRSFFPGDTVADFNPNQLAGQGQLLDFAGGSGQDFANAALRGNEFFMNPENIMNPDNIPGYRDAQDATSRMFTENLMENILPQVRSGGTSSGQFGGSASGIGQALSVDRSQSGLADALTQMDLGAYAQGLNSFNQAQNRAPSLFNLGTRPGTIIAGVGDAQQGQQQREIDADVARHTFEQNEPLYNLAALQNLTGQYGQYGGTQTGESTTTQTSKPGLAQAMGLGLMGASALGTGGASTAGKGAASASTGQSPGKGGATGSDNPGAGGFSGFG